MNDAHSELLNVRQTAEQLDVHVNTVRAYVRQGLLPDARVPGTRFHKFRLEDVERLKAQRGEAAPSLLDEHRAVNPELVNASQLVQWPETAARHAQGAFPELIRRLLLETPEAGEITIRTGDGVGLAGSDGEATFQAPTKLLPAGRVWFEFGTNKDSKRKADKDFAGRRDAPGASEAMFVFVTPRRWQGKGAWVAYRRREDIFRDVLVLDADDLTTWLTVAPAAHVWLSEQLGLKPRDAISLGTWWSRFSSSTRPALPLGLFVAGRSDEAGQLASLLQGAPRLITIAAENDHDALAFVLAALQEAPSAEAFEDSALIVRSTDVWDRIIAAPGRGALIPLFDDPEVDRAISSGRTVVVILDGTAPRRRSVDLVLPRVGRIQAAEAFACNDVDWRESDRLAVLARRSMPALVRKLSHSSKIRRPTWSEAPLSGSLAALMLIGRWTESDDDQALLADLTAIPKAELDRLVAAASQGSDAAVRHTRGVWMLASPEEAFLELRHQVSQDVAQRWHRLAIEVLLDPDPLSGLSQTERLGAQLRGERRMYSAALRRGVADSLALAGALEPPPDGSGDWAAHHSQAVMREVMEHALADQTGGVWLSLADVLPLLAEAAPDAFLSALEDDLSSPEPAVGRLFQMADSPAMLGPSGQYHHLLWALELLSWSPELLTRSMQILTRLCAYPLPQNTGNRPLASMASVLVGWARHTGADGSGRLAAADACHAISARVGWDLLKALWPSHRGLNHRPSEPRYQLWKPPSSKVAISEWTEYLNGLTQRAIEWADDLDADLPWLVDAIASTTNEDADRLLIFLEIYASRSDIDDSVRLHLFERARKTVANHKRFQSADWAMPAERRDRLHRLGERLQPDSDLRRFAYLFDWRPDLDARRTDFEAYATELGRRRREALDLVFARPDSWEQLAAIAEHTEAPTQVGWALADYEQPDTLDIMLEWLASETPALKQVAGQWVTRRLTLSGPGILAQVLDRGDVSEDVLRSVLLHTPASAANWDVLARKPHAAKMYWSEAQLEVVDSDDVMRAVTTLLDHQRAWTAISVMSYAVYDQHSDRGDAVSVPDGDDTDTADSLAALALRVLRAAIAEEPGSADITSMTSHYLGTLFDYLERRGTPTSELAQLEFAYFVVIDDQREPRAMNQVLAADPDLFVDLVRRAYRSSRESRTAETSVDPMATHAWHVLDGWRGYPGRQQSGQVDPAELQAWVAKARLQLSDLDRTDIGDELIGHTFAYAPPGADDVWPPEPVRDLLESTGSRQFENGLVIGRLNSRGVTSRGVYDGGTQERSLAEQYKQWAVDVQPRWPRTARALRALADSYYQEANRQDREAQIEQDWD